MPGLEILGSRNLSGLIQETKPKVIQVVSDTWMKPTRKVHGNIAEFMGASGQRANSRMTNYGAPSHRRRLRNISNTPTALLHTFEDIFLPATTLVNLLSPSSEDNGARQRMGEEEVQRQINALKDLFYNTRVTYVQTQLLNGITYFDKNGEFLPSSSGADTARTIDAGIPASHKTHISASPLGIADWDVVTTDIIGQLFALQETAITTTGFPIKEAYYGRNVPKYIGTNTTAQTYLRYLGISKDYVLKGQIPDGFGGIDRWIPANTAFFATEDAAGTETINTYMDGDQVSFCPDSNGVYDMVEGSYPVPKDLNNVDMNLLSLKDIEEVFGMFMYSLVTLKPTIGIEAFAGDTFAPQIRNPNAFWIADTSGH